MILIQMQHTYSESFVYLNFMRNIRIAILFTGITCMQVDVEEVFYYLRALATHTVTHILIPPSD